MKAAAVATLDCPFALYKASKALAKAAAQLEHCQWDYLRG